MSDRCFIFINIAERTGDQRITLYGSDKLDPEVLERQLGCGGAGKGHSTRMGESSAPHMLSPSLWLSCRHNQHLCFHMGKLRLTCGSQSHRSSDG